MSNGFPQKLIKHRCTNIVPRIPQAFTQEKAAEMTKDVWTRLGMDPNDKSTWHTLRTNMPSHNVFDASKFAPKAWAAVCELCGGEDRITGGSKEWRDSLIVNLGSPEREGKPDPPQKLQNWHVDGDLYVADITHPTLLFSSFHDSLQN